MNSRRFLLDTNLVIGLLAGHEESRSVIEGQKAEPAWSAVSQISRMEVLSFSSLTATEESRIRDFFLAIEVIPIDEAVEETAIMIRRKTRLKLPDAIIVATAVTRGLALLTLDKAMLQVVDTQQRP